MHESWISLMNLICIWILGVNWTMSSGQNEGPLDRNDNINYSVEFRMVKKRNNWMEIAVAEWNYWMILEFISRVVTGYFRITVLWFE